MATFSRKSSRQRGYYRMTTKPTLCLKTLLPGRKNKHSIYFLASSRSERLASALEIRVQRWFAPEEVQLTLSVLTPQGHASTRPIIFIAHSLGGVVVKSALGLAFHGDGTHAMAWVFTYGVFFLGVPHKGTKYATWGEIVTAMLHIYPGTQNRSFAKDVESCSAYNEKLNAHFKPLLYAYIFCSACEPLTEPSQVAIVSSSPFLALQDRFSNPDIGGRRKLGDPGASGRARMQDTPR